MAALISLFLIVILSLIVVRIGAIALELTGLSRDVASFQAQSAFSGVGFTTSESEAIVSHPLRRKIVQVLILLGSAGITSTIATFVLTFIGQTGKDIAVRAGALLAGLLLITLLARSQWLYRLMKKSIVAALKKNQSLKLYDYQEILGISEGYTVTRMVVHKNNWLEDQKLKDLNLHREGVLILSVHRRVRGKERIVGIPSGETEIKKGDILILYGAPESCKNLFERPKGPEGDEDHRLRCHFAESKAKIEEESLENDH